MTRAVEMLMNIRAQMRLLPEVPRHMLIGEEGRSEIVHAIREEETKVGVLQHGAAQ